MCFHKGVSRLTTKAEPPPTGDVNRDSGTDSANGGWLRRLVRPLVNHNSMLLAVSKRLAQNAAKMLLVIFWTKPKNIIAL